MKYILLSLLAVILLLACNQSEKTVAESTAATATPAAPAPEDPLTLQLRDTIRSIELKELQQTSAIKFMLVDSLKYEKVSLKEYYTSEKTSLEKNARFSSNKEKTNKALQYLGQKIAASSTALKLYKVNFYLNALLANTTKYNEWHTKYLHEDMSEMKIIFPD